MESLEREIEGKLVAAVRRHGGLCLKWVCPGWSGVPDRIILLPGGRVIFCETKRPAGGRFSARQLWWLRKLTALGFLATSACNVDEIQILEKAMEGGLAWTTD